MSDDETPVEANSGDATARAYDFFKHLTTLGLISIGGVLGLLQNQQVQISTRAILMSVGAIGLSAFVALLSNAGLASAPGGREPGLRTLRTLQWLSVALFVFGAGIFTGAFSKGLI